LFLILHYSSCFNGPHIVIIILLSNLLKLFVSPYLTPMSHCYMLLRDILMFYIFSFSYSCLYTYILVTAGSHNMPYCRVVFFLVWCVLYYSADMARKYTYSSLKMWLKSTNLNFKIFHILFTMYRKILLKE
jgi:hypothetical protein